MNFFKLLFFGFLNIYILSFPQNRSYWPTNEWLTKSPSEVNMSQEKLDEMYQEITSSMTYVDAFLIVKDGYLVYEKYFNNYNKDKSHILCSVTKSVTNIITGILFQNGYIDNINEKILSYLPEFKDANQDTRINDLTIEHMMAFTTGLSASDDVAYNSDIITAYLSTPFFEDPGKKFKYATGASQVLSAIITKVTGKSALDFAKDSLFPKLGISNVSWSSDIYGYSHGGFNSYFKPRDMLKLGFLYLNKGIWNGDTIVSPDFVSLCTQVHSEGGKPHYEKYGYNWWITENNSYYAYFAGGYGGQFIYVVPDLDLVVAITCNTTNHREDARFLINSHVVPSILNPSKIDNSYNNPTINVFPNPAEKTINIRINNEKEIKCSINILDCSGKILKTLSNNPFLNTGEINYEIDLPAGLYILEVNTYSEIWYKKLVIR